jgi:hypothetical protein
MSTNENDRELLRLAEKAAGLNFKPTYDGSTGWIANVLHKPWNPLLDDGDALRLAVKLGISIDPRETGVCAIARANEHVVIEQGCGALLIVATRRAIVRAAAEIGKGVDAAQK